MNQKSSNQKMVIMHVTPRLESGGAETALTNLILYSKTKHQLGAGPTKHVVITMLDKDGPNRRKLESAGIEIIPLNLKHPLKLLTTLYNCLRYCRNLKPTHIVGWLYYGNILASLISLTLILLGQRKHLTFHNIRNSGIKRRQYRLSLWISLQLNMVFSHLVHLTIYNSQAGLKSHNAQGYSKTRAFVIHNGVNTDFFCPNWDERLKTRKKLGVGTSDKIVLIVGRNDPQKDYPSIIELSKINSDIVFVAVGEGVTNLHGEKNFRTFPETDDIRSFYRMADFILSGSKFGEGFQNSVAEGMSCELVPIYTIAGDIQILTGGNGFEARGTELICLQTALQEALQLSDSDRAKWGVAARNHITQNFRMETCHDRFISCLSE